MNTLFQMRTLFYSLFTLIVFTQNLNCQSNRTIDNCSIEKKGDPFDGFYYTLIIQNDESHKASLVGFYSKLDGKWDVPVLLGVRLVLDNDSKIVLESIKMNDRQKKSLEIELKYEFEQEIVEDSWILVSNEGVNDNFFIDIDQVGGGSLNTEISESLISFSVFNAETLATSNRLYISLKYPNKDREVFNFNLAGCQSALETIGYK